MADLNHNHFLYDNFVLANEIEDQYNSHLDLMRFCTVDDSLVGIAGDIKKIHRYRATDGSQDLEMGEGNTKNIEVSYTDEEYRILLTQNRFPYYDEEAMRDPNVVPVGIRHMSTDMFNATNKKVFLEFSKATRQVASATYDFAAFVDAVSMLGLPEDQEAAQSTEIFAFINRTNEAEIRKALGEHLKYVEAFVRRGYIGTVAGVNIYIKKDAPTNYIVIGTRSAVTYFVKKGTEVEQERTDPNKRLTTIYSRKNYLPALTDETQAVRIVKGTDKIAPKIITTTLLNGTVGTVYENKAEFTGDGSTVAFVVESKPAVLTKVTVDGTAKTLDTDYSYTAATGTVTFTTAPADTKEITATYAVTIGATGSATIKYEIERGRLPAGLTMSAAGAITGKPTKAGTFKFTVLATNDYGAFDKKFNITVAEDSEE